MPKYIHWEGRTARVPNHQYSLDPRDAVFFYGGPFSNFVGGPFEIRDYDGQLYLAAGPRVQDVAREVAQSTHIVEYPTIEHYFQANKARSRFEHDHIRNQPGPWEAKRAGRRCDLREDWEDIKYEVMLCGLRVKFNDPEFAEILLNTGNRLIAEDSPTDAVWGIRARDGSLTGANLLGKALMQIRDELREEVDDDA